MTWLYFSDPRSIVDQIDLHDREVDDTYDYYDDATSFNFGADAKLKEQFKVLGKGDEVMELAVSRKKDQVIRLLPAGKYICPAVDFADIDCYSSLGNSVEIVSIDGIPA